MASSKGERHSFCWSFGKFLLAAYLCQPLCKAHTLAFQRVLIQQLPPPRLQAGAAAGVWDREKLPRQYLWPKTLPWQDPALALSVVHYKCMPGRGTPRQSLPTGLRRYGPAPGDVWMMCQPGHLSLRRLSAPAQWPQMAEGNAGLWGLQMPPRKLAADSNSSQVRGQLDQNLSVRHPTRS